MNNLAIKRMTVPEFLAWAETQEHPRYELIDGQPVAMAPERSEHVEARLWAANALGAAIQHARVARLSSRGSQSRSTGRQLTFRTRSSIAVNRSPGTR